MPLALSSAGCCFQLCLPLYVPLPRRIQPMRCSPRAAAAMRCRAAARDIIVGLVSRRRYFSYADAFFIIIAEILFIIHYRDYCHRWRLLVIIDIFAAFAALRQIFFHFFFIDCRRPLPHCFSIAAMPPPIPVADASAAPRRRRYAFFFFAMMITGQPEADYAAA
jgi:hypothetical protein